MPTIRPRCAGAELAIAIAAAAVSGSCASTAVTTDYDRRVDFERYETFEVRPGPVSLETETDEPDAVVQRRISTALEEELSTVGLDRASPPDLVVTFAAQSQTVTEVQEVDVEPPRARDYPVFPVEVDKGALVIDAIDARTGRTVFRSIARAENEEFGSHEFIHDAVHRAIEASPLRPPDER